MYIFGESSVLCGGRRSKVSLLVWMRRFLFHLVSPMNDLGRTDRCEWWLVQRHRGRVFSHSGQREPTKLLFLPTPTYLFRVCNLPAPRCALALKKIQSDRPTLPLDLFTHHSVTATMAVRTGMAHFLQHPIIPTLLPFFLRTTPWPFSHSVFLF